MSGGSYILSKKALEKLVTKIMKNETICRADNFGSEDLEIGRCLQGHALAIDGRDMFHQQRFFPIGVEYLMKKGKINPNMWYEKYEWFNVSRGMLKCCSDTVAAMHYISPKEMNFFEFLIYHMHPFGLEKNLTKILPRKLALNEVVEAANARSFSPNYRQHSIIHCMDEDEKYR
jgi:glycoprotein-N-acetylgalactosamine 3-beta-galactosyltransferase